MTTPESTPRDDTESLRERYASAFHEAHDVTGLQVPGCVALADIALAVRDEKLALLQAERDALIDEVKALQEDLEELGEAQKRWLQFRRERDALKAAIEKVRELLFAFTDWPDRDATDFLFRLGRHEMVYRIVAYAFPDELDKLEMKPALDAPEAPGGVS
jgi:hypothetical protein